MGTSSVAAVSRVLFGQTRREVLALLLGHPDERYHLREILRTIGGGSGSMQRELKQLVEAGIVERKAEGRQVFFSANRDSAIFPELQSIIKKTAGVVDVLREGLAPLLHDRQIVLALVYGSVAGDTETARSDVDLLIVGDVTLVGVIPLLRLAEQRLGREVNPSVYPAQEFRDKLKQGSPFLKRILEGPKLFIVGDEHVLGRVGR